MLLLNWLCFLAFNPLTLSIIIIIALIGLNQNDVE